jgi:hypothetical protein
MRLLLYSTRKPYHATDKLANLSLIHELSPLRMEAFQKTR